MNPEKVRRGSPVQLHIVDDEDLPFFRSHHAFPSPEDVSGSRRRTKTAPREERPSLPCSYSLFYATPEHGYTICAFNNIRKGIPQSRGNGASSPSRMGKTYIEHALWIFGLRNGVPGSENEMGHRFWLFFIFV